MIRTVCLAVLLSLCWVAGVEAGDTKAARMFERMRLLAGDWEGTFEWTDGRTGSGNLSAKYYLTGNGSALVEDLMMEGAPYMTTVYHLDGQDLRMTHYCAAMNQPRLKASRIDESAGSVDFTFVDVTNVHPKVPAYAEAFALQIVDAGRLKLKFTFGGPPGARGVEHIALQRVPPAAANG